MRSRRRAIQVAGTSLATPPNKKSPALRGFFFLDFAEVANIGQAFADEIFRVFANEHPEVELVAMHAASEVQQMIRRAEVLRDKQGGQLSLLK